MVKLFIQGLFAHISVGCVRSPSLRLDFTSTTPPSTKVLTCSQTTLGPLSRSHSLGGQGGYNGLYSGFGPNLFKQVLEVTLHDGDCDGEAVHPRLFARELHVEPITAGLFAFVSGFLDVGRHVAHFHDPTSTEGLASFMAPS